MIFTPEQVQEILKVIEYHHLFVISTNFGASALTEEDRNLLRLYGVDLTALEATMPAYDQMYLLGLLSSILKDEDVKTLNYSDFQKYINTGQYRPLSPLEKSELDVAKRATYTHLKGLKDRAKSDVEHRIIDAERVTRLQYEEAVSEGMIQGVQERKSVGAIISDLGHKVGEWQHDWGRIVETEMNNIFQLGRAREIENKRGLDAQVYKQVYPQACRHCINLYLTAGIGSKPRVFKLKELIANGTNIGLKVADWKPTLGSIHPFCRCCLYEVLPGHVWNEEKNKFELPTVWQRRVERKSKVKITVGDKIFYR